MPKISERKFNLKEFRAIVLAISTYEDTKLLLQHIVEGLCRTFKIKGSSIMLYDESENQLFRVSSFGLSEDYIQKEALAMNDEYEDFKNGKTVLIENAASESQVQYAEANAVEGIISILSVPIKYRNSVIGLLKIYHSDQISFCEEDLESIKVMMKQLGVVIELNGLKNFIDVIKVTMERLPNTDLLTESYISYDFLDSLASWPFSYLYNHSFPVWRKGPHIGNYSAKSLLGSSTFWLG